MKHVAIFLRIKIEWDALNLIYNVRCRINMKQYGLKIDFHITQKEKKMRPSLLLLVSAS